MSATHLSEDDAKQKISKLMDEILTCQMVTVGVDGELHARPMVAQERNLEGEFWFITNKASRKTDEIRNSSKMLLSYAHAGQQDYVSISGKAMIITDSDKIKQIWTKDCELWFPNGPSDPNIALIRFQAENAEYWNSTSNALVFAYEFIKAKLTHQPPIDLGEMGTAHYKAT